MALMWVLLFVIQALLQSALGKATGSSTNVGIFGGEEIKIEAAPYMAALFRDNTYVCGGSIIHDRLILTSAGCCGNHVNNAHIGSSDVRSTNATIIAITDVSIHPDYNGYTNDICVLRIQTRVPLHCTIAKVTLEQSRVYAGSLMNLTGWGLPEVNGSYPSLLHQTVIPVATEEKCLSLFPFKTESSFCAGEPATGRDFCDGDIGDPLTFDYEQVGIASIGKGPCGTDPALYTKVSSFYSWIHEIIDRM